jgi:hypothetical protein
VFRLQSRLIKQHKQADKEYRRGLADHKDRERDFRDGDGEDPGDPPKAPTLARVVCSDTTIEKLCEILEDNPRGTLVARDELAGWLGSFSRYKGKAGGSDLPAWLEMHRAGTVVVAPTPDGHLIANVNWDLPPQVQAVLKAAGLKIDCTDDDALAAAGHPLAEQLRRYRAAHKLATTYGTTWPKDSYRDTAGCTPTGSRSGPGPRAG